MPADPPPSTAREWLRVTIGLRGYHEWDTLRATLRNRARFWPPNPGTDQELRGRHPILEGYQGDALESLLSITDPACYLEVLALLEKPS